MSTLIVKKVPTICPKCGGKLIPILYGEPTFDAYEVSQRGEIILGGCCIQTDKQGNILMPDWQGSVK